MSADLLKLLQKKIKNKTPVEKIESYEVPIKPEKNKSVQYNVIELFMNDFEINNLERKVIRPVFEKTVLKADQCYDGEGNGYYTIVYTGDKYRIYYRGNPQKIWLNEEKTKFMSTESLAPHERLCLAESIDGLNFERYGVIKHDYYCHNFFVYYENNKYYGLAGTGFFAGGLHLFESENGIKWSLIKKIADGNDVLPNWAHPNHFDTLNCMVKKDDYYYIFVRDNHKNRRFVQFTKTKDFETFSKMSNINIVNDDNIIMYTPGIFRYFDSNYYFCIPTIRGNGDYIKKCNTLMVSNDCINWKIVETNLFDDNLNMMDVINIVPSKDNEKMYIYVNNNATLQNNSVDCYSWIKHRIHQLECSELGSLKTNEYYLVNSKIKLNFETNENGYIIIELVNESLETINVSEKIEGNQKDFEINFGNIEDGFYHFNIILCNSKLYSMIYNVN